MKSLEKIQNLDVKQLLLIAAGVLVGYCFCVFASGVYNGIKYELLKP